jgi:hypothetical protein
MHIFCPIGHPFDPTSISGWLLHAKNMATADTAPKTLFIRPCLSYCPASLGGCASGALSAAPSAALLEPVLASGVPGFVAVPAATQTFLFVSQIGNKGGQPWLLAFDGGQ